MQSKVFSNNKTLNLRGRLLDLHTPRVMGILNVTPDSFHDGGRFTDDKSMLTQVEKMHREGADVIDIGGYSTRPGAAVVPEEEERKRVVNAIRQAVKTFPGIAVSIDTFRSTVAQAAVDEGACMINDVSGGEMDPLMFATVARLNVPYVLMHSRGTPETMTSLTQYDSLLKDIVDYFHEKIKRLHDLGVKDVIVDPGFGFAKTVEQNFELVGHLDYLHILGKPVLVGLSRKSMIWRTLKTKPEGSLNGTIVMNTLALMKGVNMVRVHDVKEAVDSIRLVLNLSGAVGI